MKGNIKDLTLKICFEDLTPKICYRQHQPAVRRLERSLPQCRLCGLTGRPDATTLPQLNEISRSVLQVHLATPCKDSPVIWYGNVWPELKRGKFPKKPLQLKLTDPIESLVYKSEKTGDFLTFCFEIPLAELVKEHSPEMLAKVIAKMFKVNWQ